MKKTGIMMMKTGALAAVLLCAASLWAEPESKRELTLTLSSRPEAKLGFNQQFIFPFLQGDSFLTRDNNIKATLGAELSPISLNGLAGLLWTPLAFLQVAAGTKLGSGWNIALFGSPVYGIGLNSPGTGSPVISERTGAPFDGLYWNLYGGGAFQFDFAALSPGDWHHVVLRTYHETNYRAYSRAAAGDSWVFENDDAENRNGFNYYGNVLLGYQMPIFLKTVGLLVEMDKYLYNIPGEENWGGDLIRWTFAGLFNVAITEKISAALLVQCRTRRNYQDGDRKNENHYFYAERVLDQEKPLRLEFYRVAAIVTFSL
jgi:hypothetical protein